MLLSFGTIVVITELAAACFLLCALTLFVFFAAA